MENTTAVAWALRPATPGDVEALAELRAVVMRPDLERLGRYDARRVRQRLRDAWTPHHTSVVLVDGVLAGCAALRPAEGPDGPCWWLEHFMLSPAHQGRGLGGEVLRALLARADRHVGAGGGPVRLNVLRGSRARTLYERHGFVEQQREPWDPVDVFMVRDVQEVRDVRDAGGRA
ncbi:GNAT family N-acetyltransferase [uncultured Streptomyces sp.]|uniref:GNAT family N-acetyltransferase n=1 Tax=uncultured Streptomyces sp. TaxID=174707 RepID=UPI002627B701|nr:GNAT family N-acetyltransferase [uncultured Streptomyces sp.]